MGIEKYITKELDFTIEAGNTDRAHSLMVHRSDLIVPAVDRTMLSKRVMCTKYVSGLTRFDSPKVSKEQEGFSKSRLGQTVADVFAELTLLHGVVHGDPHHGNVYAKGANQVVVLDHGLHHHLAEKDRVALCNLINACILGSKSNVRKYAEHFAGDLWRLFPLVINPAFAFAVPSSLRDIQAANESRLPDDISLEDVWKTMLSMHESESDVLGALHSLGYVRGLLNSLEYSEKYRVLALGTAATYGLHEKALWPGAPPKDAAKVSVLSWISLQCALVFLRIRVEVLFLLLWTLSPLIQIYLTLFGRSSKNEAGAEAKEEVQKKED